MHMVIDAVAVRSGSAAIVTRHLLEAWSQSQPDDRLTVLTDRDPPFPLPERAVEHRLDAPVGARLAGAWLRTIGIRRAAHALKADAVLSMVTASALVGTGCPRGVVVYDLRHELRPRQFTRARRLLRRLTYAVSFRGADALFCISARTRADLLRRRPGLATKAVVAPLGADHVDGWVRAARPARPYAIAFGNFENKNADKVVAAWSQVEPPLDLRIVGMSSTERASLAEQVRAAGLTDRITLEPWLDDDEFIARFTAAALLVFPSDFEGFGLPVAEAMRLGIPVLVSGDAALSELTGGTCTRVEDLSASSLAAAVTHAGDTDAARARAHELTWTRTVEAIGGRLRVGYACAANDARPGGRR